MFYRCRYIFIKDTFLATQNKEKILINLRIISHQNKNFALLYAQLSDGGHMIIRYL